MRAAIDVDRLAGDEPAILADQEQAGGGDLVDGALSAERDADGVRQAAVIPLRMVAPRIDAAGRDDGDPDVVPSTFRGEATWPGMLGGQNPEAAPRAMPISPIFAADKGVRPLPLAEIEPSPQKN